MYKILFLTVLHIVSTKKNKKGDSTHWALCRFPSDKSSNHGCNGATHQSPSANTSRCTTVITTSATLKPNGCWWTLFGRTSKSYRMPWTKRQRLLSLEHVPKVSPLAGHKTRLLTRMRKKASLRPKNHIGILARHLCLSYLNQVRSFKKIKRVQTKQRCGQIWKLKISTSCSFQKYPKTWPNLMTIIAVCQS